VILTRRTTDPRDHAPRARWQAAGAAQDLAAPPPKRVVEAVEEPAHEARCVMANRAWRPSYGAHTILMAHSP
jgi:hypothetical protein